MPNIIVLTWKLLSKFTSKFGNDYGGSLIYPSRYADDIIYFSNVRWFEKTNKTENTTGCPHLAQEMKEIKYRDMDSRRR